MNYIILESQTSNGVTSIVAPQIFSDYQQAESKFHLVLASAAVSSVQNHTCMLLASDGRLLRSECYKHLDNSE